MFKKLLPLFLLILSVTIQGKNVKAQVGPNPVTVSLAIGSNSGSSTVTF